MIKESEVNEIINYAKLSKIIAGNEQSIRSNNIPTKYKRKVEAMKAAISLALCEKENLVGRNWKPLIAKPKKKRAPLTADKIEEMVRKNEIKVEKLRTEAKIKEDMKKGVIRS